MINKKFLSGILCIILYSIPLFAEQYWWEEDDFSSEGDGFKYEQIFSTRNDKKMIEAQMLALFNQKMDEYLKTSSQCAYEWMVYDEAYKQHNNWEIRIMRQSKAGSANHDYDIWFYFSNGVFLLRFAEEHFLSTVFEMGCSSQPIDNTTAAKITNELLDCQVAARRMWLNRGLTPKGLLPVKFE